MFQFSRLDRAIEIFFLFFQSVRRLAIKSDVEDISDTVR